MVRHAHTDASQRIDIEVHQIMIVACNRVVAVDREADILVNDGEQLAHILFEILKGIPNVGLGRVLAVERRVLEYEAIPTGVSASWTTAPVRWVGDDAVRVAVCVRIASGS